MDARGDGAVWGQAAREHRRLARRAGDTPDSDFAAVLALGLAVSMHGVVEQIGLYAANRFLDPSVVERLREEHRRLADDLAFFEQLLGSKPDSEDLPALSQALLQRLRVHLERDERLLYRPLERLDLLGV